MMETTAMDTELQFLKKLPSLILSRNSSSNVSGRADIHELSDEHRYTSLKDIILNSSPHAMSFEGHDLFDPSSIMIRNQLVKYAASAYVQSAAILATRNQNWFERFWEKVKNKVSCLSCWNGGYVWYRLQSCFFHVHDSLEYVVERALSRMIRL